MKMFKEAHVQAADMVRYLDGEGTARFRGNVERHLARCTDCDQQVRTLRETSRALEQRFTILDVASASEVLPAALHDVVRSARRTERGRHIHWQRAAAITLFLAAAALATTPARAWIAEWWREAVAGRGASTEVAAPQRPHLVAEQPIAASALYRFTPTGAELTIEFAALQPAGVLLLRRTGQSSAQFEVTPGTNTLPVLILPTAVRITNEAAGQATYRLLVPGAVQRVIIRAGPRTIAALAGSSLPTDEDVRLQLTRD